MLVGLLLVYLPLYDQQQQAGRQAGRQAGHHHGMERM
jgi:hypothetical protein